MDDNDDNVVMRHSRQLNAYKRYRPDDDPDVLATADKLAAGHLERHILRAVSAAPPLSDAQRARLAQLLRPVNGSAG